jgi:hypothetical protein
MKTNRRISSWLRAGVATQLCVLFATTLASGQAVSPPTTDPAILAKYDANRNGRLDPDELVAQQRDEARSADAAVTAAAGEKAIELSPFTVSTNKDVGYFAENTLAGSRINTNLADLAASITVVTKQQMEDTAAVDINDVFKYEASTEGSSTYSPQIVDRGTIKDTVAGYSFGNDGTTSTNATANRIRGLNAPDAAINNYSTNNRIPLDAYNTQSLEISRGPNSLLFGLGSPSGVVNTNASSAELSRETTQVQLRMDQNGSYRTSLAINRPLIQGKLAVAGAFLYDNRQFERKPSRDLYRREYGAVTYKPFKNTVIRGFAEDYRNDANRPNSNTPRDQVSPWLQSGRPVYDPLTRMITWLDNPSRAALGPIVSNANSPGYVASVNGLPLPASSAAFTTITINGQPNPWFVPGLGVDDPARPVRRIATDGSVIDFYAKQFAFYAPAQTNPATAVPSAASLGWGANDPHFLFLDRTWTQSANIPQPTTTLNGTTYTYGSYQFPGVTNQSVYNWKKYNTLRTNWAKTHASNYNLDFEQQILPEFFSQHWNSSLFLSAGWLRQDIDETDNYTINQLQSATLNVDTNRNMISGRPNPYFGLPFISEGVGGGLDTFYSPETDDNYRAMLAYSVDATRNNNWTRWIGRHRILGMWQEQDVMRTQERWRMAFTGGDPDATLRYVSNLTLTGQAMWNDIATMRRFYMANPGDPQATVTHSIGFYGNQGWNRPFNSPVEVWNYQNSQYQTDNIVEQSLFSGNQCYRSQRQVQGSQLAVQSYLWEDRLITTLGWRNDHYRGRTTTTGQITDASLKVLAPAMPNDQLYTTNSTGLVNYDRVMNRWNHWDSLSGGTRTIGAAFRPLRDLGFVKQIGGERSLASEFLQSLTFYYNKSDNFNPPPSFQVDYFGNPLAKPSGKGKDGGFGFNLFDSKLVVRLNWYETENLNDRGANTAAGTLITRAAYPDTTLGIPWASAVLRIRKALAAGRTLNPTTSDPNSVFAQSAWNSNTVWDISSDADQRALWDMLKLPYNYYAGLPGIGATQQSKSKGAELQVTFNPTRNWTVKLTGSKNQAMYRDVAKQYDAWVAVRMPVWTALGAADIPDFVDPNGNRRWSLKNFWTAYGYSSNALAENTNGNVSTQGYWNVNVQSIVATSKALEGAVSPLQRVWSARGLTNYSFTNEEFGGRLKGWSVGGSLRWESRAAIGYYGKVGDPVANPTVINVADISRPIWGDNGNYYSDAWLSYYRKIYHDRIGMKLQLNCNNWMESGRLLPTQVNFDGSRWAYRIIDPRQWILTSTFTF